MVEKGRIYREPEWANVPLGGIKSASLVYAWRLSAALVYASAS
jgi:hypothetical protein